MKRPLLLLPIVFAVASGCGYTKEEYQLQADKLTRSVAKQRSAETRADEATAELEAAKQRVAELEDRMRALGVDLAKSGRASEVAANIAERERALAEYRARTARVEEARARLSLLRTKLEPLAEAGVEVRIRKNRMVIVLPATALFDGAKEKLKKDGKEALRTIAATLKDDPVLSLREYQIAGHTDAGAKPSKTPVDNVTPTVGRAKAVLAFLTDPKEGALDRGHFSAAGYGDVDPIAPNDTDENREKNRRIEIVVVPTAGELVDLRALAIEPQRR